MQFAIDTLLDQILAGYLSDTTAPRPPLRDAPYAGTGSDGVQGDRKRQYLRKARILKSLLQEHQLHTNAFSFALHKVVSSALHVKNSLHLHVSRVDYACRISPTLWSG